MSEDVAAQLRHHLGNCAFHRLLDIELTGCDAERGEVAMVLRYRPEFERGDNSRMWHGGPIAALIDIAGDFALIALLKRGVPTIDLRIDYLRPAIDTDLHATARVVRAGRSIGAVDIELANDAGKLVAIGRGTYSTLQT